MKIYTSTFIECLIVPIIRFPTKIILLIVLTYLYGSKKLKLLHT